VWVGTTSKFSEMGDTAMQQLIQLLQGSVVAKIFYPSGPGNLNQDACP